MEATIVSFYPRVIPSETKPGIYPGHFSIPASDGVKPVLVYIGDSVGYVYLDESRGSLPITIPAKQVAKSIVDDFCSTVLEYENGISMPGLFWVEGRVTEKEVKHLHIDQALSVAELQKNWFIRLVKIADTDWNKSKNLSTISDVQRFACNFLNMDRPWNVDAEAIASMKCPACKTHIPVDSIVCQNCHVILNKEEYAKYTFAKG